MKLGDMKTEDAIKNLNDHLADKSYIEGYQPSQSDTVVYEALSGAPSSSFPHALRWYNHIKSYGSDKSSFPGVKKDISAFGITAGGGGDNKGAEDDDDDLDLFGSDDEQDEEAEKLRQTRLDQYAAKKAKKPGVIAKSSVVLDVKPWDDETDMKEMERLVRTIETDGLKWGASKLMPLAYGIHKLQIMCVVEDEKVSVDWLQEEIESFSDFVQSVDVAAFQKI
uniref:Elongation factor 1-beta n=1 Tax=Hadrurus spadix TaxID=141984 RepID=A0A1W7RAM4_9SCOR